jgi:glycosyltransferase involved in cell wall biosynthesis
VILSVIIITDNEEANIARTLASVQPLVAEGRGEIIVVDSGSTDRTVEIAKSFGAKVYVEEWKGYAAQKNSAIDKATGDWILSLDADEEVEPELMQALHDTLEGFERVTALLQSSNNSCENELTLADAQADVEYHISTQFEKDTSGFLISRKNQFLRRWIKHGGFWPDPKLRLFRRGAGRFEDRAVHEDVVVEGRTGKIRYGSLIHHSYPTLADYVDHMNRYSSLGAEMLAAKGYRGFSLFNIVLRPSATFIYNYFFRLGFLDGREGLLLHLYHAVYVSWKYAKASELSHQKN